MHEGFGLRNISMQCELSDPVDVHGSTYIRTRGFHSRTSASFDSVPRQRHPPKSTLSEAGMIGFCTAEALL